MTDQELKQYCGAVTVPDREIMDAFGGRGGRALRYHGRFLIENILQAGPLIPVP